MRIGIDCRFWSETGVGRYIRNLVKELAIIDKKNQYFLFVKETEFAKIKTELGIGENSNFSLVATNIPWHTLSEQIKFPLLLTKYNLDLVHFPYFSVPIFYKKPYVVTIHDLILHNFSTGQASTLPGPLYKTKLLGYKYVIQKAAEESRKIITVSESTKKEIVKQLHVEKSKIVVTYEGIDEKLLQSKNSLGIRDLKLEIGNYFLYVGNAYPHKNLSLLLDAFSNLASRGSSLSSESRSARAFQASSPSARPASSHFSVATPHIILVGKKDYFYERLEKEIVSKNLSDNIIVEHAVSDKKLADLYKHARALVLPSKMEGFGLPALEAMANKCLVMASNISAFREILSGAGIYFDPNNVDNLTSSLQFVLAHDKKYFRKNIEIGYERSKKFSWKKTAKETLSVYQSCIGV